MPRPPQPPLAPITPEQAANRVIGSGATFPLTFSSHGGVASVDISQGDPKVNQSIHTILSTRKGERINRPTFGCFAAGTMVILATGTPVPIEAVPSAVGVLGVRQVPSTDREPGFQPLCRASVDPPLSRGLRPTVRLFLSNRGEVICTPDHLFLLSDHTWRPAAEIVGASLTWVDQSVPDFWARLRSGYSSRGTDLYRMPMSANTLRVESVEAALAREVYDLPNSSVGNYALAAGPVVHNSDLPRLVFEQNSAALLPLLRFETATAIQQWEKRIQVMDVQFATPAELANPNRVGIRVIYKILKTNQVGSYVFPFEREAPPFSLNLTSPLGTAQR